MVRSEGVLPGQFKDVQKPPHTDRLHLSDRTIPWLKSEDKRTANLSLITLHTGIQFYFGNALRGKLIDVAKGRFSKNSERNERANTLLYSRLPGFLAGDRSDIKTVQNPNSDRSIYYVGTQDGIRVYFMRLENINETPVILRIAACPFKNREVDVLKVISTEKNPKAT